MIANINDNPYKVYRKLPKVYNGVFNYNSVNNTAQHYADGWRDIVQPTITVYQRKGDLIFDDGNDVFTYEVIDFTAEEIADYDQRQEDADASAQKFQKEKNDGVVSFDRAFALIYRRLNNGTITVAQAKAFGVSLYPLLEPLYKGQWHIVKINLDGQTPPNNAKLLAIFNIIKSKVDDYILENY